MLALSRRLSRSAFVGLVVWVALLLVPLQAGGGLADLAAHLLLLAPLVLVPLFLDAAVPVTFNGPVPRPLTVASWLLLPGAVAAAISFLVQAGPVGGALVAPWALATGAVALWAVQRAGGQLREGRFGASEVVLHAGLAVLPAGAACLFFARAGIGPGGSDLSALLTAAHVHYGAFAAPVWSGLLGRAMQDRPRALRRVQASLGLGLVVGFWLAAAGVATSGGQALFETVGMVLLALSAIGTGLLGLVVAPSFWDRWGGMMVAISGGALALAMGLALWFGLGARLSTGTPDVVWMEPRHGWLLAVGFGLWGALGWRRLRPRPLGR